MKTVFTFTISLLLSVILMLFLSNPNLFGLNNIPPLGPLLSPSQGYLHNGESASSPENWTLPKGKGEKAQVVFDRYLIPHIYTENDGDAYLIQGYLEARLRFWQMDFITKVTAGRVSEIFGERALEFDKKQRRKGLAHAARNALEKWKKFPKSFSVVKAYTQGVNTYLDQLSTKDYPIEYKILDYKPEKWTEYRTALFFIYMSDVLCSREKDFELYNVKSILGDELFAFLFDRKNKHSIPIIPSLSKKTTLKLEKSKYDVSYNGPKLNRPYKLKPSGLGSNNWAIAPEKSETGHAIMANDPHLPLKLPSIWFLIHICTPNLNVMGVSFPGTPGVTLGFNEDIAWGVTNVGHDVLDWLIIDWNKEESTYKFDGEIIPIVWHLDTIKIKNTIVAIDSTPWTKFGPIWTLPTIADSVSVVMHWLSHQSGESDDLSVFPSINKANDFSSFSNAASNFDTPPQNFVVASRDGDIGMRVQGQFPIRNSKNGRWIDSLKNELSTWTSYIPKEKIPQAHNPEQGFLASANQISTDSTYPYYYVDGDFRDERARTINQYLSSKEKLGFEDMKSLQYNSFNISAQELIEASCSYLEQDISMLQELCVWDAYYNANDTIPTFFEIWLAELNQLVFDELHNVDVNILIPKTWRLIELIDETPNHKIFDLVATDKKEVASDILNLAWKKSLELYSKLDSKKWYKYRGSHIDHLIANFEPFGIHEITAPGTGKAPNALRESQGPSWRLICQPGDGKGALGIYPGGQSGHPGSDHYTDLFTIWEKGEYISLRIPTSPDQVDHIKYILQRDNL